VRKTSLNAHISSVVLVRNLFFYTLPQQPDLAGDIVMSTTRSYHQALLALSGNPALAAARTTLLASINNEELVDVITYSIKTGIPRESVNAIATRLLDELVTSRADGAAVAHAEGEGYADGVQIEVRNNNHSAGASNAPTAREGIDQPNSGTIAVAKKNAEDASAPTTERQAAQISPARVNLSSTANLKRTGSSLAQVGKKRKAVSSDFEADEAPITRKENVSTENNEPGATSSSARATYNNTAASINWYIPWEQIQNLSIMTDLELEDSDDEEDEDYTENPERNRLEVSERKKKILIPDVEIEFCFFTEQGIQRKKLTDFSSSFVEEVVRKFNQNYLKGSANRKKYKEMLKDGSHTSECVNRHLHPDKNRCHLNEAMACEFCVWDKKLCATLETGHGDDTKLAIYKHESLYKIGSDWRLIEFWVRK
jgi:hypothetical protein